MRNKVEKLKRVVMVVAMMGVSSLYIYAQPAPSNFQTVASSPSKMQLTWIQGGNVNEFRIERRLGGSSNPFQQIAAVGGNLRQYNDTGLWADTSYTYRIRYRKGNRFSSYTLAPATTTLPLQPATVSAGPDVTINGPSMVILNGMVTVDGLRPTDTLSYQWNQISGPAGAVIANPMALDTTADLTEIGTYVFRLTVTIRVPGP